MEKIMMSEVPKLEDLLDKIDENLDKFFKNCPYLSDEIDPMAPETFKNNLGKNYFYLCNDPERAFKCLRYYHQATHLGYEVEFRDPKLVFEASTKYHLSKGFSKEGVMRLRQAMMITEGIREPPHYCDHMMWYATKLNQLVRMLREVKKV